MLYKYALSIKCDLKLWNINSSRSPLAMWSVLIPSASSFLK